MLARQQYLISKIECMNDIVDKEVDVQKARLKCDNIKWEAQRVARSLYGDHSTLDIGNKGDKPFKTHDLSKLSVEELIELQKLTQKVEE